jgi:5'-methylthioadenosine phosphorylase
MDANIGIIGGSGLYQIEGFKLLKEQAVKTPFGDPSDTFSLCEIDNIKVAFLPRHGKGHKHLPMEVPSRANIWAFKSLGVSKIITISAVGSLHEDFKPGDFVVCDQMIDRTRNRISTFFGEGVAGHIGFADPFCPELRTEIINIMKKMAQPHHDYGTIITMEGPAFSTRAESHLYRSWGAQVIGMTGLPEAKLAREAEIALANIAMVTDYDCWREAEEDVTVEMVVRVMQNNSAAVKRLLPDLIRAAAVQPACSCNQAAKYAIMTNPDVIPAKTKEKLDIFYGKYWKK